MEYAVLVPKNELEALISQPAQARISCHTTLTAMRNMKLTAILHYYILSESITGFSRALV